MTKVSTVSNRKEDNGRTISCGIWFSVHQTINVFHLKAFEIGNVFDVILPKAYKDRVVSVCFSNIEDAIKEMLEDIHLVITCGRHDEVRRTGVIG